jgi:GtrA-like protein
LKPETSLPSRTPASQPLLSRVFWFGVGGVISVTLNIGPFHWLRTQAGLSDGAALAISLSCVTIIFSIWNYFVNFRTKHGWRECQFRYLAAVGFCYLLTYGIALTGIKKWGQTDLLAYAIVATTQVAVSGVKFFLYHFWVYPHAAEDSAAEEMAG